MPKAPTTSPTTDFGGPNHERNHQYEQYQEYLLLDRHQRRHFPSGRLGFGPIAAAVYNALNTDCGFSERVVTMNSRCGLLLDILYDEDWVMETASGFHLEVSDNTVMNVFGAALPCLAQAIINDIGKRLKQAENVSLCTDLKVLVGINTDVDGHELAVFVPFEDDAATNDYVQFKCARSARIVERYLNGAAYSNRVEKWIRSLIEAASIDAIDTSDYAEV